MNLNLTDTKENNIDADFTLFVDRVSSLNKREGDVVNGQVIDISSGFVVVDIGMKSEGRIPISEFRSKNGEVSVKIGDELSVLIEKMEGRQGVVVLSREKAFKDELWKKFENSHESGENIEGKVIGKVKGGFAVDLGGMIGFLPGSQVDVRTIRDSNSIMGVVWDFKILKMDKEHGNIVISRRAILEEGRKEAKLEMLSKIKEGMVIEGVVKNITEYGAFLDFGAVDGLLHIIHISWSKISHPSEVLTVGQKLSVVVIKYHEDTQRISVGLKQMTQNPWEKLRDRYVIGSTVKGKIASITDYGAFVSLDDAGIEMPVEGLVYHTEIHWTARGVPVSKLVSIGDEVEVLILDIDIDRHRISLSMKRCTPNPWIAFVNDYPIGSIIDTVVNKVADFGVFVVLAASSEEEYPINILVPIAEFSWNKSESISTVYNKGDLIKCMITNADVERERIAASIRQLTQDPLIPLAEKWLAAEFVVGEVIGMHKDSIDVQLSPEVVTSIEMAELANNPDEQTTKNFVLGQKVELVVTEFDKSTRQFKGSIKALQVEREGSVSGNNATDVGSDSQQ